MSSLQPEVSKKEKKNNVHRMPRSRHVQPTNAGDENNKISTEHYAYAKGF